MSDPEKDPPDDDQHDPEHGSEHDPVRALLADLGGERPDHEGLPAEVAARLDETLAALVAERAAAQTSQEHTATGTVVPLRPRWLPRLAAAAAAVVVLSGGGLAAADFLRQPGHDASTSTSSADGAAAASPRSPAPNDARSGAAGGTASTVPAPSADAQRQLEAARSLPRLTSGSLASDVRSLLAQGAGTKAQDRSASPLPGCPGPSGVTDATTRPVLYDGTPAVLVVRAPSGGARVAEVWACSGQQRLASTTVTR